MRPGPRAGTCCRLRLPLSLAVLAVMAAAGCASGAYTPGTLQAGATVAESQARLGEPTGRHALADGQQRLEFARGPYGRHTYMLDFDAQGRLISWEQVLNEKSFQRIRPGLSRDDVERLLGRPSEVQSLSFQKRELWSYRYDAIFCQWFQVSLDRMNQVVEAGYGPDPLCDDDRNGLF